MSMPVNGDYTLHIDKLKVPTHERAPLPPPSSLPFPYSAMWLAHECQTTWQYMEMDTGKFRNVQDSGRGNRYVSGRNNSYYTLCGVAIILYQRAPSWWRPLVQPTF